METKGYGLLATNLNERQTANQIWKGDPLTLRHIVSTNDLSANDVMQLIEHAERLRSLPRAQVAQRRTGSIVTTLFYEPSTRTRMSFEAAVVRLGGHVVTSENARENSSAKKGETLEDVFRVVGTYTDAIVIRHHEAHALTTAAPFSPVPVINAGAGAGEHPTQALLDVYTLYREFGRVEDLRVCVVGDLKYGRTVHSLLRMLSKFRNIEITLVHPQTLSIPASLEKELTEKGLTPRTETDFYKALRESDVVYQTRVQTERFQEPDEALTAAGFQLLPEHLLIMKEHARILHPLPRVDEIHPEVDLDIRAAYFRQAENGLYMRMAVMDAVLGGM